MDSHRLLAPSSAVLIFFLVAGCLADNPGLTPTTSADNAAGEAASLHAVMSERLNLNNDRLNVLLFDLHRTETELARERSALLVRIGEAAGNLQEGAASIPALSGSLSLSQTDSTRFNRLARQLETQAANLVSVVETQQLESEQLADYLEGINATCDSCHALYRDPESVRR